MTASDGSLTTGCFVGSGIDSIVLVHRLFHIAHLRLYRRSPIRLRPFSATVESQNRCVQKEEAVTEGAFLVLFVRGVGDVFL